MTGGLVPGLILEANSIGLTDILEMKYYRKKGMKDDSEVLMLAF